MLRSIRTERIVRAVLMEEKAMAKNKGKKKVVVSAVVKDLNRKIDYISKMKSKDIKRLLGLR